MSNNELLPNGRRSAKWHRVKTEEEKQIDREIGKRIKYVRLNLVGDDNDLRSFAAELGVTATAVHQWENGSGITHYKLVKIAEVHNISVEWLLGLTDRPTRSLENQMRRLPRKVRDEGYKLFKSWLDREEERRSDKMGRKQNNDN